jgi:hypothetical protein
MKDRSQLFRDGTSGGLSGFSVTYQNNRLAWSEVASDKLGGFYRSMHEVDLERGTTAEQPHAVKAG